jgi:hypothetical protein
LPINALDEESTSYRITAVSPVGKIQKKEYTCNIGAVHKKDIQGSSSVRIKKLIHFGSSRSKVTAVHFQIKKIKTYVVMKKQKYNKLVCTLMRSSQLTNREIHKCSM